MPNPSPAALAAAEYLGSLLPDSPSVEARRVAFERTTAAAIDAGLAAFDGEFWVTVRDVPDETLSKALVAAGFRLDAAPGASISLLPPVHLRVTPTRVRVLRSGSWQRPIKVADPDASPHPRAALS